MCAFAAYTKRLLVELFRCVPSGVAGWQGRKTSGEDMSGRRDHEGYNLGTERNGGDTDRAKRHSKSQLVTEGERAVGKRGLARHSG